MAEARLATDLFYLQKQGFHITGVEDGYYTLTLSFPYPSTLLQQTYVGLHRTVMVVKQSVWPASITTVLAVMSGVSFVVVKADSNSWFRSGFLANILWQVDSKANYFNPLHKHLAPEVRVGYLAAAAAFTGLLAVTTWERLMLRLLLRFKSWLYMKPKQKTPFSIKVWGGLVRMFSGNPDLTYSFSLSLPSLPLPTLKHTVGRYLESVKPLMTSEEFAKTKELAENFSKKQGWKLQFYLGLKWWTNRNYVAQWWEKYVYLRGRTPLAVNSNYYILDSLYRPTNNQTERASNVAHHYLKFKDLIENEELKPLLIKQMIPLCMEQYSRMFGTCRIPGREFDKLKHTDFARHIVVLYRGEFFQLNVYHGARGTRLVPYSRQEIKQQLDELVAYVDELRGTPVNESLDGKGKLKSKSSNGLANYNRIQSYSDLAVLRAATHGKHGTEASGFPVLKHEGSGIAALTASPRSNWAEIREIYFSDGVNHASLRSIEKAAFLLVLDDATEPTMKARAKSMFHGNGFNRYFDKSLTLVVFRDGYLGLNTEHSWADAPPVAHLFEYGLLNELRDYHDRIRGASSLGSAKESKSVINLTKLEDTTVDDTKKRSNSINETMSSRPIRLQWEIDEQLERSIQQAGLFAKSIGDDLDLELMQFDEFGAGFMKKKGFSPDAFVQMALQLAYFRDRKQLDLTYESSMTRLFSKGRTETVRSLSDFSKDWVYAMEANKSIYSSAKDAELNSISEGKGDDKPSLSKEELVKMLHVAADHHALVSKDAMVGLGIDRHLFALYITSRGFNMESEFLNQALSIPWRLSTSQQPQNQTNIRKYLHPEVAANFMSPGGGFGPVADDGYGVSYMIVTNDFVFFHVSSKFSAPNTSSKSFIKHLKESMIDMKTLLS